jgi:hypothetical protein
LPRPFELLFQAIVGNSSKSFAIAPKPLKTQVAAVPPTTDDRSTFTPGPMVEEMAMRLM